MLSIYAGEPAVRKSVGWKGTLEAGRTTSHHRKGTRQLALARRIGCEQRKDAIKGAKQRSTMGIMSLAAVGNRWFANYPSERVLFVSLTIYSYLSATIGSTRDARRAGR